MNAMMPLKDYIKKCLEELDETITECGFEINVIPHSGNVLVCDGESANKLTFGVKRKCQK